MREAISGTVHVKALKTEVYYFDKYMVGAYESLPFYVSKPSHYSEVVSFIFISCLKVQLSGFNVDIVCNATLSNFLIYPCVLSFTTFLEINSIKKKRNKLSNVLFYLGNNTSWVFL